MSKSYMEQEIEKFEKRWDAKLLAVQDKVIALEVKVDRIKSGRKHLKCEIVDDLEEKFIQMEKSK